MRLSKICTSIFTLTLSACMVGPDYHSPNAPLVNSYSNKTLPQQTIVANKAKNGVSQKFRVNECVPHAWWANFKSPQLNLLVEKGIENSPTLASAIYALKQAKEAVNVQIGNALFPSVDLQASAIRQKTPGANAFGAPSQIYDIYNTSVSVSYSLDIFGGARRELESLIAQIDYQKYQLEAAYLSLTSNIVTTVIANASYAEQIKATQNQIRLELDQLKIVKAQFELGAISSIDVLTQESELATLRATLPPLEQNYAQTQHLLAVLIGEFPSQSQDMKFDFNQLTLPKNIPVSTPTTLVQQRPDIRAAESLLHAASGQIGVATAGLYPQFSLTGNYGYTSSKPAHLLSSPNAAWNYMGQILQPIFHGGALRAQRRASIAAFEQAAAQYQQTVLQAFQNVADTLRALDNDAHTLRAQTQGENAARESLNLSKQQFQLGGVSYIQLLTASRQYQQARLGRIRAEASRLADTAAFYGAMGGNVGGAIWKRN